MIQNLLEWKILVWFANLSKIISRQTSVRPISEYLTPGTKTEIEYDCMPSFANVLLASITDIDNNRIVESFGIKKGIELENNFINRRNYDTRRWNLAITHCLWVIQALKKTIRMQWFGTNEVFITSNVARVYQGVQPLNENAKMIWEKQEKIMQFIEKKLPPWKPK